jgi:lipopolysaccharide transport system permease protein
MSEELRLIRSEGMNAAAAMSEQIRPLHALLPDTPLIQIRVSKKWAAIELREIWRHRELLYFLVWRDLKVRYKQTVLGASWVILQPVLMTLVFAAFLGKIARFPSGNVPYILFLYCGLLPWTFFSNALSSGSYSLIASANMITKVYFPRSIIPAAAVLVRLSDFIVASLILVVLLLYYRQPVTWSILLAPLLVLHLTLLALGLGLSLAALNVKYRDIGTALPVLLQLWMFASPVIYPSGLVAANWKWAYELNPLAGIVEGFRASLLGLDVNWRGLAISAAVTMVLLVYSAYAFQRLEDEFADVV